MFAQRNFLLLKSFMQLFSNWSPQRREMINFPCGTKGSIKDFEASLYHIRFSILPTSNSPNRSLLGFMRSDRRNVRPRWCSVSADKLIDVQTVFRQTLLTFEEKQRRPSTTRLEDKWTIPPHSIWSYSFCPPAKIIENDKCMMHRWVLHVVVWKKTSNFGFPYFGFSP